MTCLNSSCRRGGIDEGQQYSSSSTSDKPYLILRGGNQASTREEGQPVETVLGSARTNPYTVAEMTAAWNRIYGSMLSQLPATHHYVRFAPANEEEYLLIENAIPTQLYDYPLENEVLIMGDYYPQPGLGEEDWPYFYAVVEPGFQSPISGYTVLEELVLLPDDTYVVADAYRATGNSYTIYREQSDGSFIPYTTPSGCQPGSPDYPFCLTGDSVTTEPLDIPCEPGAPIWPQCFWSSNPSDPNPDPLYNDCGCVVPNNKRIPAGCIQVRNTENNLWEGVRLVKVIMKNTWFTEDDTWTNHQGCFHMNKEFSGEVWSWVRYKNNRCRIRGVAANWNKLWQWKQIIKDYIGKKAGPTFNNYQIKYDVSSNHGSNYHRLWSAATINNALHEFHDMAGQLGIATPPYIDVYAGYQHDFGYALMKNWLLVPPNILFITGWYTAPFIPILNNVYAQLPDVYIGTDQFDRPRSLTYQLKRLAYHEFAHASHFINVGWVFWRELVEAAGVTDDGAGNKNSFKAGRIAICESWAHHIEFLMTSMRFIEPDLLTDVLERRRNRNEDHIPIGVHWDVQDAAPELFAACDWDPTPGSIPCGAIRDHISGLTIAQLFNILTSDVTNPLVYRDRLKAVYNLNSQEVDNLFEDYLNTQ